MATALPPATSFTGASVTQGNFKTAITNLIAFLQGLLGTDGTIATALSTLGLKAVATSGAYSDLSGTPAALPPNGAAGGDLGGSYPNPTVGGLQGHSVSATAPTASQVLIFTGGVWTPTTTVGTPNVLSPYATSTTQSQAHGLSVTPTFFSVFLQCLTAEHGYNVGDIATPTETSTALNSLWTVSADATNTYIVTNASAGVAPTLNDRSTQANFQITAAFWKLVVTPKIN